MVKISEYLSVFDWCVLFSFIQVSSFLSCWLWLLLFTWLQQFCFRILVCRLLYPERYFFVLFFILGLYSDHYHHHDHRITNLVTWWWLQLTPHSEMKVQGLCLQSSSDISSNSSIITYSRNPRCGTLAYSILWVTEVFTSKRYCISLRLAVAFLRYHGKEVILAIHLKLQIWVYI